MIVNQLQCKSMLLQLYECPMKMILKESFSQGNENHDNWIFSMTTLLSSTLIFNVLNAINEDSLEKLKYPFIFVTSSKFRQFRLNTNNDDMLQNI